MMKVVKIEDILALKGKDRIRNEIVQLIDNGKLPQYVVKDTQDDE